jgi:DNA-binding NarL/FixJ family response regulator
VIRVVVVDDHDVIRREVSGALMAAEGIEVVATCADGDEAVEVVTALRPDVVVMDLAMPRMDGAEATRLILTDQPGVRVLIHTGGGHTRRLQAALDAGAAAWVWEDRRPEQGRHRSAHGHNVTAGVDSSPARTIRPTVGLAQPQRRAPPGRRRHRRHGQIHEQPSGTRGKADRAEPGQDDRAASADRIRGHCRSALR